MLFLWVEASGAVLADPPAAWSLVIRNQLFDPSIGRVLKMTANGR